VQLQPPDDAGSAEPELLNGLSHSTSLPVAEASPAADDSSRCAADRDCFGGGSDLIRFTNTRSSCIRAAVSPLLAAAPGSWVIRLDTRREQLEPQRLYSVVKCDHVATLAVDCALMRHPRHSFIAEELKTPLTLCSPRTPDSQPAGQRNEVGAISGLYELEDRRQLCCGKQRGRQQTADSRQQSQVATIYDEWLKARCPPHPACCACDSAFIQQDFNGERPAAAAERLCDRPLPQGLQAFGPRASRAASRWPGPR
jgi:hypothetical protein